MPGPGIELIGAEETAEVMEVLQSGYLSRYGPSDDPPFGGQGAPRRGGDRQADRASSTGSRSTAAARRRCGSRS